MKHKTPSLGAFLCKRSGFWLTITILLSTAWVLSRFLVNRPIESPFISRPRRKEIREIIWCYNSPRLKVADLIYGRSQVDLIMQHRPAIKKVIEQGDVIYEWAARRFGGLSCGIRISWDPGEPEDHYLAENSYPQKGIRSGEIRIASNHSDGSPLSPQEVICGLTFELVNISNGPKWEELRRRVVQGEHLSRNFFIEESAKLEYLTALNCWYFLDEVWSPFAQAKGLHTDPQAWQIVMVPASFEEWKTWWVPGGYPYSVFGPDFDRLVDYARLRPSL